MKKGFFNLKKWDQLTREEVLVCMPELNQRCLEAIFSEKNVIDLKEIMIILVMLGPDSFLMKMNFVFELFDKNKNGVFEDIELKEFFLSFNTIIYNFSIMLIKNELKQGEEKEWEMQSKKRVNENIYL